jgi:hypothetical protein
MESRDIVQIGYNGTAIERAERLVPTCYVGLARRQLAVGPVTGACLPVGRKPSGLPIAIGIITIVPALTEHSERHGV